MKRREFLSGSLAAMLAAGVAPRAITARDKSDVKPAVIGKGEHKYECNHAWGELPKTLTWQTTHGVCVDADANVYIKMQGMGKTPQDTIVVFDSKGKFIRSFGKEYHGGGHGIDIRKEDGKQYLYLTNSWRRTFCKTDLKGEVVWTKNYPTEPMKYTKPDQFSPTNVAFAPDGGFYVGDGYGSHLIHQYDKDAKWVHTWGGFGDKPGQMKTPHGIWLDDRKGREAALVVADRANARLQYFTLDGKHISFVKDVSFPAHIETRGDVMLVPDLHARVSLFDKDNKLIVHLGEEEEWRKKVVGSLNKGPAIRTLPKEWPAGKFIHPHDACFDANGNIFVVEWVATGRVTLLKKV